MRIVYIDLDDTAADFMGSEYFKNGFDLSKMYEPGFFLNLKPTEGSQAAIRKIMRMGYDVHFLSQALAESAHSYSEKAQWVGKHFPDLIYKINLTQDKGLFKGDFLIDDNFDKWKVKFEANGGRFLHFRHDLNHRNQWEEMVLILEQELEKK